MSSRHLSQSYFLNFVITFCSVVTERWIITCNLACSSSPRSHPGAYKLLSIASFNFQAKQAVDTKGPCVCFNSSANYASLGQRGAEVGESWPHPSIIPQLRSCARLPFWQRELQWQGWPRQAGTQCCRFLLAGWSPFIFMLQLAFLGAGVLSQEWEW